MNCQNINHLLDANTPADLTLAQCEKIDRHLASCPACNKDWANFGEIVSLPVPVMSAALRGRIAAVLSAQHVAPARRAFRPFLVGGLLLAGAALAAALALQFARRDPESMPVLVDLSPAAEDVQQTPLDPIDSPQSNAMSADTARAAEKVANKQAVSAPLDPHSIVVLKRPEVAADAPAIAKLARCHDALVRQLRTVSGLNFIADAAVLPYEAGRTTRLAATPLARFQMQKSDGEIARQLGAGNVLVVSTEGGCAATLFNSLTGASITGLSSGDDPLREDWDSLGTALAKLVRDKTLNDVASVFAGARATVLNTALNDAERLEALMKPHSLVSRDGDDYRSFYDPEIVAAAIRLGTKSANANVRESVWAGLRGLNNQSLVQPLLQVLANDSETRVRMQAALSLNTFLDQPGVREALQRAAAEDPSREPEMVCCILTVREAAQRASIADRDFRNWVRSTLLDESLPVRSRLLSLQNGSPDLRFMALTTAELGSDAARVAFDIGRREQSPQLRAMAWNTLRTAAADETFLPVLLGDLASHADEWVRVAAAKALEKSVGNPEVRAAFERAVDDPSINVRSVAASALARPGH